MGWSEQEIHHHQIGIGSGVLLRAKYRGGLNPGMEISLVGFSTHDNQVTLNNIPAEALMLVIIGPGSENHWEALTKRPFQSDPRRVEAHYNESAQTLTITLHEEPADTRLLFNLGSRANLQFEPVPRAEIAIIGPAAGMFWADLSTPRPTGDDPFEGDGWQPERII
ncbi:MAG TPA: hypothetical protein VFS21_19285 [Roseiflexaceae bacterium]|nr:hypothetical protein [Roseiflexaceae bacterium]